MSFWDKVKEDKWFAFASVTLAGIVVYLGYDNYTRRKNQLTYEGYHGQESVASNHARLKEGNILEFGPNARNEAEFPIYKICITGGPCAGKTTSIEEIKEIFSNRGYRVLVCPEIPTMIVLSGGMILMGGLSVDQRIHFQSLLIKLQIYIEDYFTKLAAMSKMPAIILCDRGTMDPYAYVTQDEFQAILDEENWNIVGLRDRRYDCVVFLVTAADGAEDHYTLSNNVARSEGIELARELDKKTQIAWNGHPHLTIVPNVKGETFKQKIQRAVHSVEKCVGINSENRYDTKYQVLEGTPSETQSISRPGSAGRSSRWRRLSSSTPTPKPSSRIKSGSAVRTGRTHSRVPSSTAPRTIRTRTLSRGR